ncbi:N,N-dimethylformamidase large subunit [Hyaloraphidium curvatum]|nr:N,N-dimethylformamidase large subunit [Hyaloraphidium curvatum]
MAAAELPIAGYLDRLSARPGERIAARVSVRDPSAPFKARLVRVVSGDPNPAGPGMDLRDLSAVFSGEFPAEHQPIRLGSHGTAPGPKREDGPGSTWSVLVWTNGERKEERAILTESGAEGTGSMTLLAATSGASAEIGTSKGTVTIKSARQLAPWKWHRIWLSVDPAKGMAKLGVVDLETGTETVDAADCPGAVLPSGGTVVFAADAALERHSTGKLEDPAIYAGAVSKWSEAAQLKQLAAWDFSRDISTQDVVDTGPQALHAKLHGVPARGMVGSLWSGSEHCWRHAPAEYAAIHFHEDDLEDCGWKDSFVFTVPEDLPSAAYAFEVSCGEGRDYLPFYVLPKREGPRSPVLFLASTFTYQAYFNHARGNADASLLARMQSWGAYPHNPDFFPIYGRSTYNKHPDGSGISHSSRLRPTLTMRPGFLTFDDARGSGLRHYPADTHLLSWLEARGIPFDVATDEDLDAEGAALLRPYACVLTGSHPEYHTQGTLDALYEYTRGGPGKLCYLGGNGFYWRIARPMPHLIELRRAEGGIRAWAAEPGEYFHQSDGALGGLWRRQRRPPQLLVGVGFSGQGMFEGTYYRLTPAARAPEHSWIFDGVDGDTIGDYGLSGGGAAGFELDRADPALGTPAGTTILAASEDPPRSFVTVPEEWLTHMMTISGEPHEALKRGEIVHFATAGGGEVFSVGSITFCGSLWDGKGFGGGVSRMLENVVRRFGGLEGK